MGCIGRAKAWLGTGIIGLAAIGALSAQPVLAPLPPAQVAFEKRLDAALPVLSPAVRYQTTQQGLAEAFFLHDRLTGSGAVSPNGWVLECASARSQVEAWLDRTQSLTGVYAGAAWLEQIGLTCTPSQSTPWSAADVRRIARASGRASHALPPAWQSVAPLYRRGTVQRYLSALNKQGNLEIRNRPCAQAAVAQVNANALTVTEAWGRIQACPVDPASLPLSDGSLSDRYPDAPLATITVTPFLGLDRWSSNPLVLVPVLSQPGNYARLFLDLTNLFPIPPVVNDLERPWLRAFQATKPGNEKDAFSALYTQERKQMRDLAVALSSRAPSAEECQSLGQAQHQGLEVLRHPNSWGAFLQNWQAIGIVCPDQALTQEDLPALQAAWQRTWDEMPLSFREQLGESLPSNAAEQWWDQQAHDTPPVRRSCLSATVKEQLASGQTMSESWMAARAVCAPAYQTQFPEALREGEESR